MFERENQFIADFNLNKIKRLGTFFTLDQLKEAGIHPAIFQFISAELDDLIFTDRKRLLEKSQFDYSGPVIGDYFGKIAEEIKKNKLLPFDICKKLVYSAVTFNTHFLVNPRLTLSKYIFEDELSREFDRFKILLNHTYFYGYYREIIIKYLEKKRSLSVSIEEFKNLVKKLQTELLNENPKEFIENDLETIAEFFNIGEIQRRKLSCEVVTYYLRGKEMNDAVNRIKAFLSSDNKAKFDIDEFKTNIFSNEPIPLSKDYEQDDSGELGFSLLEPPLDIDAKQGEFEIAEEPVAAEEETIRISVEAIQDLALASVMTEDPNLSSEHYVPEPEPEESDEIEEEISSTTPVLSETEDAATGTLIDTEISDYETDSMIQSVSSEEEVDSENASVPASDFSSILDELLSDDAPLAASKSTVATEEESPLAPFNFETLSSPADDSEIESGVTTVEIPDETPEESSEELSEDSEKEETLTITLPQYSTETLDASSSGENEMSNENFIETEVSDERGSINENEDSSYFALEIPELTIPDTDELEQSFLAETEGAQEARIPDSEEISVPDDELATSDFEPADASISENNFNFQSEEEEETPASDIPAEEATEEADTSVQSEEKVDNTVNSDTNAAGQDDDLLSGFSAKESMIIIKDIFKNNSLDFLETIEKIALCENYMQAQLTLKSVLYAYNINELSDSAQIFSRTVTDYFNKKGK